MKIIILAAGKGTRLMPLTRNTPKPLIDIGDGMTLLETQIESIQKSNVVDEIIIITGYLSEQIEAKVNFYKKKGINIKTIYNPFYSTSNNLISLWFARHEMNGSFLITNGDNIFSHEVFANLVTKTGEGITLIITKKNIEEFIDGDMKVTLSEDSKVIRVNKNINKENIHAESPGLAKIEGEGQIKLFKDILDELIRDEENLQKFWLESFNALSRKGIQVDTFEIDGKNQWREIDFHMDLMKFKGMLSEKVIKT